MKVEDLIVKMFKARNAAHIEHWKTNNGEAHRALGEYYEGVVPLLDDFVETFMGGFDVIEKVEGQVTDISEVIHEAIIWLTQNRESLSKNLPALENIIDELTALHMKTLFKLKRLR